MGYNIKQQFQSTDDLLDIMEKYDATHPTTDVREIYNRKWKIPPTEAVFRNKMEFLDRLLSKAQSCAGLKYGVNLSITKTLSADTKGPNIILTPTVTDRFNKNGQVLTFNMNLDYYKLIDLPAFELFSIVTYHLVDQISKFKTGKEKSNITVDVEAKDAKTNYVDGSINDLAEDNVSKKDLKDDKDKLKNKERATKILSNYLRGFLLSYTDENGKKVFDSVDNISKYIASQIVENLSGKDLKEMVSPFFAFSMLNNEIEEMADKLTDQFTETALNDARISSILLKNKLKVVDSNALNSAVDAAGYLRQAEKLIMYNTVPKFANLSSQRDNEELRQFCINYVKDYMLANGIQIGENFIDFDHKSKGAKEMGQFIDEGESEHIKINWSALRKGGNGSINFPQLVSTLTHECTHAVDAIRNKSRGITTKEGFGLQDHISSDISSSGLDKKSEAGRLLAEINNYCYYINPNERHARLSEIAALKALAGVADEEYIGIIKKTIADAKDYCETTLGIAEKLGLTDSPEKNGAGLDGLEKKYSALSDSLEPEARKLFEERIEYLKGFRTKPLNWEKENETLSVYDELSNEAEERAKEVAKDQPETQSESVSPTDKKKENQQKTKQAEVEQAIEQMQQG